MTAAMMTRSNKSGRPLFSLRAFALLMAAVSFAALLPWISEATAFESDEPAYLRIDGPCSLDFPKDHGEHPDYRTEWWYYTGNLETEDGRRLGFQLTFFRSALSPPGSEKEWPEHRSEWRTRQIYLAHAAVSDLNGGRFHHAEEAARGALGLAGARSATDAVTVFLKNWSARLARDEHALSAKTDDFSIDLTLKPQKKPVPHGDSGYSRKGSAPESASCYYSFTNLKAEGTVTVEGKPFRVKGKAWMDHEFSSAPLEPDIVGWDWLSLQLSDDVEIMVYLLRRKGGGIHPVSSGTFVDAAGDAFHLGSGEIRVDTLSNWTSPHTKAVYPSGRRLRIESLGLDVTVAPALDDQEMQTPGSTNVTYWEGSVSVSGVMKDHPVEGRGYVELTGYDGSLGDKI